MARRGCGEAVSDLLHAGIDADGPEVMVVQQYPQYRLSVTVLEEPISIQGERGSALVPHARHGLTIQKTLKLDPAIGTDQPERSLADYASQLSVFLREEIEQAA